MFLFLLLLLLLLSLKMRTISLHFARRRNLVEAIVTNASPLILRLHDKTNQALKKQLLDPASDNVYRIDKLANRMGFNRQLESARVVAAPAEVNPQSKKVGRPSDELITAITAMDENIEMLGVINGDLNNNNVGTTSTAEICAQAVAINSRDDGDEEEVSERECV